MPDHTGRNKMRSRQEDTPWAWGSNDHGQLGPQGGRGGGGPVRVAPMAAVALACSPWGTLLQAKPAARGGQRGAT